MLLVALLPAATEAIGSSAELVCEQLIAADRREPDLPARPAKIDLLRLPTASPLLASATPGTTLCGARRVMPSGWLVPLRC